MVCWAWSWHAYWARYMDGHAIKIRCTSDRGQKTAKMDPSEGRAGAENQGGSNGSHGAEMANVSGEIMGWSRDFGETKNHKVVRSGHGRSQKMQGIKEG